MGRYYQERDHPNFDYELAVAGELPGWELRGPIPDLQKPFFVCIGATQVFGRFSSHPFPELLSRSIGLPVLNLGLGGHGPQTFLDKTLLSVINRAEFAIVQLTSARSGSNSAFANSESGRAPGERLSDGNRMTFEQFLTEEMSRAPHHVLVRLVEETRNSWVATYRDLLSSINIPKILHWFSTILPYRVDDYSGTPWDLMGPFPQLVNGRMVELLRPYCDAYVETVCRRGRPQLLWDAGEAVDGAELRGGKLYNAYYPSPEMHEMAAKDLLPASRALLEGRRAVPAEGERGTLVVACNSAVSALFTQWCGPGVTSLAYGQLHEDRELLLHFVGSRPRVIHVRRRNMLEEYLQHRRAYYADLNKLPPVDVDIADLGSFAADALAEEEHVARTCRYTDVLDLFVEDCAEDPEAASHRLAAFLQQPVQTPGSSSRVCLAEDLTARIPNHRHLLATVGRLVTDLSARGE